MVEDTIHTRTFQVTVGFTDEQQRGLLSGTSNPYRLVSDAIRSEIIDHLETIGLDVSVTIVQRMEVG